MLDQSLTIKVKKKIDSSVEVKTHFTTNFEDRLMGQPFYSTKKH